MMTRMKLSIAAKPASRGNPSSSPGLLKALVDQYRSHMLKQALRRLPLVLGLTWQRSSKRSKKLQLRSTPQVLQIELDVSSRESVERAAATVEQEFGKLDILINNAGVIEPQAPIADSDPDEWWDTWTINLRGPYLVTRSFIPLMLKGGDKQVATVSSVGAHVVLPGLSAYQPSKLAVLRFMEFVAAEYGP